MTVAGSIALSFGLLPIIFAGFASAGDLQQVQRTLSDVRVAQLDADIFDAHVKACQAEKAGTRDVAILYELRVQEKLPVYRVVAGHNYQLQPCN